MEEKKSEKKTKKTGLIILVIILLVICSCMGAFIFINKDKLMENKSSETKKQEVTKEEEEKVVEYPLAESLYKKVKSDYDICEYATQPLGLKSVGDKLTLADMDDDYVGQIVFDYIESETTDEYTEEEMKAAFEKVFGPNTYRQINKIYFNATGSIEFDSNTKKYVSTFHTAQRMACVTHLYNREKVIKAVQKDDKIEITTAFIFNGNFKSNVYKDAGEQEDLGVTFWVSDKEKSDEFIDEHKDELHQLTYTFTKAADGKYYYTQVEKTK